MPIFKLRKKGKDLSNAELIEAPKTKLNLEKHLEGWLEQSPCAIAQEPILIIGRRSTALLEDRNIFPDLLGLDKDGNIVIVELKKGKTPREVVAQLLEYASWANDLSDNEIHDIASQYFLSNTGYKDKSLRELFSDVFETDEIPSLNSRLRMFIAAEQISPSISRVCRFLRMEHGVDVNCIEFSIYQTESGEILVSSQVVVGQEEVTRPKKTISERWSGDKPVKLVVWEAVQELTKGDKEQLFSPKEVTQVVLNKYPNFNKSTVGCQIISDCVNHTSRHHYPGGEDHYWWIEKGKYRLFNPEHDNIEE
ncbi:MAG: hypothetical protein HWN66_20795 [Candidatus Helarchaeota archaeon]|nr:hypothetical protein [Candidatus Helarchaeota archaeon]